MLSAFWPSSRSLCQRPHLALLLIAGILAPLGLFAVYAVQSRQDHVADIEDRLIRRAAILAEHARRVIGTYEVVFDGVERAMGHMVMPDLSQRLAEMEARTDFSASLLILDRTGTVIASSNGPRAVGGNRSDREYFSRAVAPPGIAVSAPFIGRIKQELLFALSRRLADGNVVAATLYGHYFEKVFGTMAGQDGLHGVVNLYREDGRQLVRFPRRDVPVDLPPGSPGLMSMVPRFSGTYRVEQPRSGGGEHIYAFHRVEDYPLYVTYGVAVTAAMEPWRRSMVVSGLLAAAASALLAGAALLAIRRVDEARMTEARLQEAVAARTAEAVAAIRDREDALRLAERAHNAKAHFLAAASHDLRQPIQALRLFMEVLDARLEGDENRRILGHASAALRGAEDLLGALLDVSTLDAGMVAASLRPVALQDILGGLAEEFGGQARARFLDFRVVPTSAWVETDPVLLSRLLRNLLSNALRYTRRGGILLGCRRDGDAIRVEVWDTGPGIPADKLESVFEDFVQLDNPERDRTKGLGLGLAVVRRMAVLLRHTVAVRSWEGRGTVFSVRLRRCELPLGGRHTASGRLASPA
ncbi:MAG: ATP-binding protein [Pseudomonadota bacterium]